MQLGVRLGDRSSDMATHKTRSVGEFLGGETYGGNMNFHFINRQRLLYSLLVSTEHNPSTLHSRLKERRVYLAGGRVRLRFRDEFLVEITLGFEAPNIRDTRLEKITCLAVVPIAVLTMDYIDESVRDALKICGIEVGINGHALQLIEISE